MINTPSKILGLSIGTKSLFLAELSAKSKGGRPAITNLAEFPFPPDLSLSTPVELGQALAQFLRTQKFSARDLYIGLPARRLITRRKDLPPASASVAASTLRLQAESEFSSATGSAGEADSFIVDFAGQTSSSEAASVLLIATAQSCIDQCAQLAKAANLRLRGITAASAALATVSPSADPSAQNLILSLSAGAAELVVANGAGPTQLRHLAIANAGSTESLPALVGEIRRTVASLQQNGAAAPLTLALWDDASSNSALLAERIGMPVTSPELRSLATQADGLPSVGSSNAFAPAVAVALAALTRHGARGGLPVDFLHSRLAPPKEPSKKRPLYIAIGVGGFLLLVIILCSLDIYLKESQLNSLQTKSANQSDKVKVAQTAYNRLDEVNHWIHRTPQFVPCMRDLTVLVPDTGNTIWATSLSISSDPKIKDNLTAQAVSLQEIKDLKNKMLETKQFIGPIVSYPGSRSTAGATDITFSIEFNYQPPQEHK